MRRHLASRGPHLSGVVLVAVIFLATVATDAPAGVAAPARGASASGVAAAPSPRKGAPTPPGGVALTWTPAYMSDNHHFTVQQARELARDNDLLADIPAGLGGYEEAMRRANPRISLLVYANATLADSTQTRGLPDSAFAHTAGGARIHADKFGTTLMESSSPTWRKVANQQCDDRVAATGFDGCLVDLLTLGVFSKHFVTGQPADPTTGRTYTQRAYRTQMQQLAAYYRRRSPDLVHVGNSVENAYRYWRSKEATSRPLVNSQPAAQMEDFLRSSGTPVGSFPDEADWVSNVDVVRDMQSHGTVGLFTTKLWVKPDDAQVAQWQGYTIASFLMGANGYSYLAFTRSRNKIGVLGRTLPYRMPKTIGRPRTAMQKRAAGVYVRRFSNGLSVVNPGTHAVTIRLSSRMRSLDGRVSRTLRLAPNHGDVLLKRW